MDLHYPLILDGATGTELQKRGYTGAECAEKWVIEHPEAITEIQQNYVKAGSDIVYAPTFSANRVKLEENGLFNKVDEYNKKLVAISKAAVNGQALVGGDIAPTGKFLAPLGDVSFEELVEIYTEQARALNEAGADLFAIETMMTVSDARAAVLAVKSICDKPVLVSFTCNEQGRSITGCDAAAILLIMEGLGVDAFGLNCSVGPAQMAKTLTRLSEYASIPLLAKANAGLPQTIGGKTVYRCEPQEYADCVPAFAAAGVGLYGGCCGSNETHIKALHDAAQTVPFCRPAQKHPELLPAATEKEVFLLPADAQAAVILPCTEDLAEKMDELDLPEEALLGIRIERPEELDTFAEVQHAISHPLCLFCEDASLLEEALRLYQGRPLYEGSLPEAVLSALQKKYGVIY